MADRRTTIATTTVTRHHLPYARVLARSYLNHHPDHEFVVLVVDGAPADQPPAPYTVVGPDVLDVSATDFFRMATAYTAGELTSAVKPLALRWLLTRAHVVIYLQPEIQVFGPLHEVADLAASHDIVLAPRLLNPLPRDHKEPGDTAIMGEGMFDLGFLAVSRDAKVFLDFWADRLRQDAIMAPEAQIFADQRWGDQIPTLFRHTVLRDPGYDVGYWNLHERPLATRSDGTMIAGGEPLRFVHFSGYQPEKPWLLSRHCQVRPRILLSENPEVAALCENYRQALIEAGYRRPTDTVQYEFDRLPDGTPLTVPLRRLFRHAWVQAEQPHAPQLLFKRAITEVPPHPFGDDAGLGFRTWLASPSTPPERAAGLNRLLMNVWANRGDLQRAYPWPCGADSATFRQWCRTFGVQENMVPDWALPVEPPPPLPPVDQFGVNLAGYLTAELGLGEMGRIVHKLVEHAGIPLVSVSEEHSLACGTGLEAPPTTGAPRFPVSLMCVNADQTELLLASHPDVGHQRYRIGLWAWELEDFPKRLHDGFDHVDEVWTVSEFCRQAFARLSLVPVKVLPVPVLDPGPPPRRMREPGTPVRFFFAFDFNSTGQRKNPWGVVRAFRRAFPGRDDVRLVIKAINGQLHTPSVERLLHAIGGDERIEFMTRYLSAAELDRLYADADCYVSLHRSEGFGLTVTEAMARGMAVIATDYSSTTEFFDGRLGWPIPYRMVEVGPGWAPYQEDAMWADPDLEAAALAMREVADNPAEAQRRGRAAREHVLRTRTVDAAAAWVRTELEHAYRTWQLRGATSAPGSFRSESASWESSAQPLAEAREALRWRADVSAPSRLPLAPALRRAVLRVIDHYDVHQRRVMGALAEGVARSLERLDRRFDDRAAAQDRRLESLESQLRRHAAELRRMRRAHEPRRPDLDGLGGSGEE